MQEHICKMDGCEDPPKARGLCKRHYLKAHRAGTLSDHPLGAAYTDPTWHRLSNIGADTETADCSVCGPGARVRIRTDGKGAECYSLKTARAHRAERKRRKEDPRYRKDQQLRFDYKITLAQYELMVQEQDGRCVICKNRPKVLVVDHCHETGRVRGLLCSNCNTALGLLKDDPSGIKSAAAYLLESMRAKVA